MSRPNRKQIEAKVIGDFINHLNSLGKNVEVDESITDKPDLVFTLDGKRVGCELMTLTYQDFEKWSRQSGEVDKPRELWINNEPHVWLEQGILSKNKNISEYTTRHGLDQLWLLVHVGHIPAFGNEEDTIKLMKWSAKETEHNFSEIWFSGEKSHFEMLWKLGTNLISEKPQQHGYDSIIYRSVKVDVSQGGRVFADLGDSPPQDKNDRGSFFLRAAYFDDLTAIKYFIGIGIDVNFSDDRGFTALRYAAGRGNINIVKHLIKSGAKTDLVYNNGPLSLSELCSRRGYDEIADLLENKST